MPSSKFNLLSLALVLCLLIDSSSAQSALTRYMAQRSVRYHHHLWHQIRENWNSFSSSTQRQFRSMGWDCPNPARDSRGNRINNNFAGEDFLYMHRQMIATANSIQRVSGWTNIPAPGDRTDPVPPNYSNFGTYKSDNYYNTRIRNVEQNLKDPSRLRRMSLNALGLEIESGIHNTMHMRWSAASRVGYRGGGGDGSNGVPNIDRRFDSPSYDWLVDTYSSHVNPYFWKLHGWIDNRIDDWRRANGLSSIRWSGTWTGGAMSNLGNVARKEGMGMDGMDMGGDSGEPDEFLENVLGILMKSGVPEFSIADVVDKPTRTLKKKQKKCRRVRANH